MTENITNPDGNPLFSGVKPTRVMDNSLVSGSGLIKVNLNLKMRKHNECIEGLTILDGIRNENSAHYKIVQSIVYLLKIATSTDMLDQQLEEVFGYYISKADALEHGRVLFGDDWKEVSYKPLLLYVRPKRAQVTVAFWKNPSKGIIPDISQLSDDSVIMEFSTGENHRMLNHIISLILGNQKREYRFDGNVIIVNRPKSILQSILPIPAKAKSKPRQSPFPVLLGANQRCIA